MKGLRLLCPLWLILAVTVALPALSAQAASPVPGGEVSKAHHDARDARDAQGAQGVHDSDAPKPLTKDMADSDFFVSNFAHLIPHEFGDSTFYNVNLWQLFAVGLVFVVFSMVRGSFAGGPTHGFVRVFRGWCHWLRDEVVYGVMGKEDGRRWAPFFLYLFFFIAFMNLLGLLPVIGVTATASFYVTGALAWGVIFVAMLTFGIMKQGVVGFFVNLLPHGMPVALIPLMAVVELVGLFIKPFALTVRLFANMLGGHMVVYSFLGMIFLFAKMTGMNPVYSWLAAIPAVGMSVFIMIIEGFIALLQAYVFTYLSVIFIQQSMHPAH